MTFCRYEHSLRIFREFPHILGVVDFGDQLSSAFGSSGGEVCVNIRFLLDGLIKSLTDLLDGTVTPAAVCSRTCSEYYQ